MKKLNLLRLKNAFWFCIINVLFTPWIIGVMALSGFFIGPGVWLHLSIAGLLLGCVFTTMAFFVALLHDVGEDVYLRSIRHSKGQIRTLTLGLIRFKEQN